MPRVIKQAELNRYLRTVLPTNHPDNLCRHCYAGWLYLAKPNGDNWQLYKVPCLCSYPHGWNWTELLDDRRVANLASTTITKPEPHHYIHPSGVQQRKEHIEIVF